MISEDLINNDPTVNDSDKAMGKKINEKDHRITTITQNQCSVNKKKRDVKEISCGNTALLPKTPSEISTPTKTETKNLQQLTKPKSKCQNKIIVPICPSCKAPFVMDYDNIRSPVMSMNCEHTICYNCVQHFVEKNRKKQKRNNIGVCSCPIDTCGAKRSFNEKSCNYNEQLILFYELTSKQSKSEL